MKRMNCYFLLLAASLCVLPLHAQKEYPIGRCVKMRTSFFYAQSPDFHKLGLCYYLKILYL